MKKRQQSRAKQHRHTPGTDEIAQRAFELYTARGQTPGDDLADWFQAEKELRDDSPKKTHAEQIDLGPVP